MKRFAFRTLRLFRRIAVGAVGLSVLVVGIALLFLPGPAFVVIPLGIGILALDFVWARRWLDQAKRLWPPPEAEPSREDGRPTDPVAGDALSGAALEGPEENAGANETPERGQV